MRAAVRESAGPPEVLSIGERPRPEPGTADVLVRVAYAGLNRADLLERAGRYGRVTVAGAPEPATPPIPGIEFSGTVESCGPGVFALRPGDRVCGLTGSGAHAEYVAVHAETVARVPDDVSLHDAATIPEAFLTAYDALFTRGAFGFGDTVLVHAIGSGVGLASASLASQAGGFVFGTSRTPGKLERARAFGMRAGWPVDDAFLEAVKSATNGRGVDIVLDFVGGAEMDRNIQALATGGRIVQIGTLAGLVSPLNLGGLMAKRATIVGTVLRTRGLAEKIGLAEVLGRRLLPAFADGRLRLERDRTFALDDIAEAHRYMEGSANFGKIVIEVGGEK